MDIHEHLSEWGRRIAKQGTWEVWIGPSDEGSTYPVRAVLIHGDDIVDVVESSGQVARQMIMGEFRAHTKHGRGRHPGTTALKNKLLR